MLQIFVTSVDIAEKVFKVGGQRSRSFLIIVSINVLAPSVEYEYE